MKIDNKWDLQEDLALKFGRTFIADYSNGFTELFYDNIIERVPNYWITPEGQTISNEQKEKLCPKEISNGPALTSYKMVIIDLSDGQSNKV